MGATAKRHPVGIGDGIGLGHDFAEDEHKNGHGRRGNDGAAVAECLERMAVATAEAVMLATLLPSRIAPMSRSRVLVRRERRQRRASFRGAPVL